MQTQNNAFCYFLAHCYDKFNKRWQSVYLYRVKAEDAELHISTYFHFVLFVNKKFLPLSVYLSVSQ